MSRYNRKPVVLFLTSYPPRPCGIATFSRDLITAITEKFGVNYEIKVCALENSYEESYSYPPEVLFRLNTHSLTDVTNSAQRINDDERIGIICIQHEFGLWGGQNGAYILDLIKSINKPVLTVLHTVLPNPSDSQKLLVQNIGNYSRLQVVMTENSSKILQTEYGMSSEEIIVIPHGTHHLPWNGQKRLKKLYGYKNNLVLSTFGLLGPNKSIETTIEALPELIKMFPTIKFLVLGRTHPELIKTEGESYRISLERLVDKLKVRDHVQFVNEYLSLPTLLEYLKLTDIYIFSSKDPHQAVSGTFSYAMSCGCPVISTPIPHAAEALDKKSGAFFNFEDAKDLAATIKPLLGDSGLRKEMALHAYQKTRITRWENVAVAYNDLFFNLFPLENIIYQKPAININHILRLTDDFGMVQFSKISEPDRTSGYTIDDNARALIAMTMCYNRTKDPDLIRTISTYLEFIKYCQGEAGDFQNYVDIQKRFHKLNNYVNLDDSNGRAVWALGFLIANGDGLPKKLTDDAEVCLRKTGLWLSKTNSPRAIAFVIKGLYFYYQKYPTVEIENLIILLANKLISRFLVTSDQSWVWFENSLTYANSILPEALILAYDITKKPIYMKIGMNTFNFLLAHTFVNNRLKVISNRSWLHKGHEPQQYGEQPIDVAYTVQTLAVFHRVLGLQRYRIVMEKVFNWFLGNNQIRQVVYDHHSGGCYDGLEKDSVNLNQGAESTVCYLMARLTVEEYTNTEKLSSVPKKEFSVKKEIKRF